jgi:hypothetical protein
VQHRTRQQLSVSSMSCETVHAHSVRACMKPAERQHACLTVPARSLLNVRAVGMLT